MKAIARQAAGPNRLRELLVHCQKTCRSVLEYAAPVWAPAVSNSYSRWSDLQTVQNLALRIATGSLVITNIVHLHIEIKVLPLEIHSKMISKQYFVSTRAYLIILQAINKHLLRPQPPRQMKFKNL